MIGTSWKMGLVKFFVYGATFSCKIIIMMIMIMKITIAIINRSADLKLRNTDINQWSSI